MQQTKTDVPPQSPADPEQKFSRDEAARYLGISRRTLEQIPLRLRHNLSGAGSWRIPEG